ncbi:MAG: hypothetical protein JW781_08140 [Deltaproteobacteria bacterium]|nr:hypothetical protein [Candidatus Anaeroferrophillacea bacterium]
MALGAPSGTGNNNYVDSGWFGILFDPENISSPAPGEGGNGFPAAPLDLVAFGTSVNPTDVTVNVAAGPVAFAPRVNVDGCADAVYPLLYVYLPGAGFGVDLSRFVRSPAPCTGGVLTLDLGTADFTGFAGLYYVYVGYADAGGNIMYNAYTLVVE